MVIVLSASVAGLCCAGAPLDRLADERIVPLPEAKKTDF